MLKYQLNADRYSSCQQIVELLLNLPQGSSILDVGTASGYLGEILADKGYYLVGIERDHDAAKIASKFYDDFMTSDVEVMEFCFRRQFDAIVLADILEHLRDPLAILVRLREQLETAGKLIISVPNVANIYVRFNLLLGKFDYAERGILDETHLRFFTWKTINALVRKARLSVAEYRVTPIPLPLVFPLTGQGRLLHFVHQINWMVAHVRKQLFAYQFILVTIPTPG